MMFSERELTPAEKKEHFDELDKTIDTQRIIEINPFKMDWVDFFYILILFYCVFSLLILQLILCLTLLFIQTQNTVAFIISFIVFIIFFLISVWIIPIVPNLHEYILIKEEMNLLED